MLIKGNMGEDVQSYQLQSSIPNATTDATYTSVASD